MDDETAFQLSQDLARRINREALVDPSSLYAGKFVGIANGQVAVVADDLGTMLRRLGEVEPNNRRCCCIEASRDYTVVQPVLGDPMPRIIWPLLHDRPSVRLVLAPDEGQPT